ncbi:MAG: VWA domain-containing protein [Anaerolineae bacterium]|nr:VWA domain-containing protein [Anaerolineae bacterium]
MTMLLIPVVVLAARQAAPAPRLEITGVNASEMPTVIVTANVYDALGQPMRGLTAADFSLTGELAEQAQIINVENISDNNLPFASVLLIDTSSSMIGTPIENARLAAHAFIDNIGSNDPVAIMVFDTQVVLLQDYTTDKAALHAVIDGVQAGGETALYQASYDAIVHAASSPTPRRAVILLSDGAEYGGRSTVAREAAAAEALVRGVPVYTIGLGFGADRTYLQELASSTNARTYDLPTPEQLTQIYTDLAALLRSQYVITLDAPLPLDGTQYNLQLAVNTPEGAAEASAVLRAPIPVPIVRLPRFDAPLSEPTDIEATVLADDPLTSIIYDLDGNEPMTLDPAATIIHIDPVNLAPGDHVLTVTATNDDGDQGSDVIPLTIAALPSQISLSPDPASLGAINQPQTITVQTSGQTPATAISISFNNSETATDLSEPYSFSIDPMQFPPGDNSVTVRVTNAGGVTATQTFDFTVAALPPQVAVTGVQEGQRIEAPVTFRLDITTQEDIAEVDASVNGAAVEPNADGSYTLDPINFAAGANALTIRATTAGGLAGTARVNVTIAALPPQITVNGLEPDEVLGQDRDITFDFVSQAPIARVTVLVDEDGIATLTGAPFGVTLRVLDFAPGAHTLSVVAVDANGQSSTLDVPFSIAPEPAFTATATAVIATQAAQATATQQAEMTASAVQATQGAQEANATGTQIANASETAAAAMATQGAQATRQAQATATQGANASSTVAALATESAQAAQATQSAVDAASTQGAQATQTAQSLATQTALDATATAAVIQAVQIAQITATAETRLTVTTEAQATQTAVSAAATATDAARAIQLANDLATLNAQMTATAEMRLTITTEAQATQTAESAAATATDAARATQLANDLATLNANITATAEIVQQTATQQALMVGTGDARATEQAIAETTGTAIAQATVAGLATQAAAEQQATQAAENAAATQAAAEQQATQAAENAAATQGAVDATATQDARSTATQVVQETQDALATRAAVIVAQTQAATRDALATANAQARQVAQETQAARATRAAETTQTQQANTTATAVQATQSAEDATATQAARDATAQAEQTLNALEATATQFIINATATRHALETRSASDAVATQTAQDATATVEAEQTGVAQSTLDAQATLQAQATVDRASLLTVTAEQLANLATGTADANATPSANILATEVQSTQVAQANATTDAQATIDTRLTAVGPTATPQDSGEQGAPTGTPPPSPTLTEIQAQEPPASSNVAPILIVLIVVIVVIIVLVLVMRGRGTPPPRR